MFFYPALEEPKDIFYNIFGVPDSKLFIRFSMIAALGPFFDKLLVVAGDDGHRFWWHALDHCSILHWRRNAAEKVHYPDNTVLQFDLSYFHHAVVLHRRKSVPNLGFLRTSLRPFYLQSVFMYHPMFVTQKLFAKSPRISVFGPQNVDDLSLVFFSHSMNLLYTLPLWKVDRKCLHPLKKLLISAKALALGRGGLSF